MKVPEREIEYLSPSSFLKLEENPVAFWKEKIAPYGMGPKDDGEEPIYFRVGRMVDQMIQCQWEQKPIPPEWHDDSEALGIARDMFVGYVAFGGYERLLHLGIADMQEELWGTVPGTEIVIHGYSDVKTVAGCVVDIKTSNAGSEHATSPPKGYRISRGYDKKGKLFHKEHKKFGLPMHEVKEAWAVQLAFYYWIMYGEIRPYTGFIHLIQPKRWTEYQAILTVDFQNELRERVENGWEKICTGTVVPKDLPPDLLRLL